MLTTWKPRGPQDPHEWNVTVLAMRSEQHRDALVVRLMLQPEGKARRALLERLQHIKLPGAYGLILLDNSRVQPVSSFLSARAAQSAFHTELIGAAREYHTQFGWDYAWFEDACLNNGFSTGRSRAAGRSPTQLGTAMKHTLKQVMPSLVDRSFREKGVSYDQ